MGDVLQPFTISKSRGRVKPSFWSHMIALIICLCVWFTTGTACSIKREGDKISAQSVCCEQCFSNCHQTVVKMRIEDYCTKVCPQSSVIGRTEYEEGESKEKKPIYSVNTEKHAERELVDGNASWIKCFVGVGLLVMAMIKYSHKENYLWKQEPEKAPANTTEEMAPENSDIMPGCGSCDEQPCFPVYLYQMSMVELMFFWMCNAYFLAETGTSAGCYDGEKQKKPTCFGIQQQMYDSQTNHYRQSSSQVESEREPILSEVEEAMSSEIFIIGNYQAKSVQMINDNEELDDTSSSMNDTYIDLHSCQHEVSLPESTKSRNSPFNCNNDECDDKTLIINYRNNNMYTDKQEISSVLDVDENSSTENALLISDNGVFGNRTLSRNDRNIDWNPSQHNPSPGINLDDKSRIESVTKNKVNDDSSYISLSTVDRSTDTYLGYQEISTAVNKVENSPTRMRCENDEFGDEPLSRDIANTSSPGHNVVSPDININGYADLDDVSSDIIIDENSQTEVVPENRGNCQFGDNTSNVSDRTIERLYSDYKKISMCLGQQVLSSVLDRNIDWKPSQQDPSPGINLDDKSRIESVTKNKVNDDSSYISLSTVDRSTDTYLGYQEISAAVNKVENSPTTMRCENNEFGDDPLSRDIANNSSPGQHVVSPDININGYADLDDVSSDIIIDEYSQTEVVPENRGNCQFGDNTSNVNDRTIDILITVYGKIIVKLCQLGLSSDLYRNIDWNPSQHNPSQGINLDDKSRTESVPKNVDNDKIIIYEISQTEVVQENRCNGQFGENTLNVNDRNIDRDLGLGHESSEITIDGNSPTDTVPKDRDNCELGDNTLKVNDRTIDRDSGLGHESSEITIDGNSPTDTVPKNRDNCELGDQTLNLNDRNTDRDSGLDEEFSEITIDGNSPTYIVPKNRENEPVQGLLTTLQCEYLSSEDFLFFKDRYFELVLFPEIECKKGDFWEFELLEKPGFINCKKTLWSSRHTANGKEKDLTSILELIQRREPLERHQFINCLNELSNLLPDVRNLQSFLQENIPKHMRRQLIECMRQKKYRNFLVLKMLANLYAPSTVLDQRYHIQYSEKFLYNLLSFILSKPNNKSSAFGKIRQLKKLQRETNSDEVKSDLDHLNDTDGKKNDKDLPTELSVNYSEEDFQDLKTLKENNSATIKEPDYKFHDSDKDNVYETSEQPEWIFYNSYKDNVHVTTEKTDDIFHNSDENNVHETYLKRDDVPHDSDDNYVYKTVTGDMLHESDRNDISELKGLISDDDFGIKENTTAQAINSHSEKLVHVDNLQGAAHVEKCRIVGSTTERLFLRLSKSAKPIDNEPHEFYYYKLNSDKFKDNPKAHRMVKTPRSFGHSECIKVRNQPGLKAKINSLVKSNLETDIDPRRKCDHVTEIDSGTKCDLEMDIDLLTKYDHTTGKGLKDDDCSRLRDITWLPVSQLPVPRLELTVAIVHSQAQQVLDRIAGGETVGVQDSMKFEILRVCTFRTYPGENKPFRILLASAGLYFASEGDEVICYTCGIRRSGWNEYDKPMEIHKQLRPNCAFLLKNESVNVPIPELSADSLLKFRVLEEVINSPDTAPVLPRQRNEQPTGRYGNFDLNTTESPQYRFFTPPPKHPQYAVQSVRLDSFNGWPENILQTPTVMAECGYYYAGFGDCVRCFHCGIGLRHWTEEDHPWIEHARWSRDCAYLRQKKGEEFIQNVHLAIEAEEEPEDLIPATATGQPAAMSQVTPNDEMSQLLLTDAAQSVLEMGYQPRIIKKAIDIILQAEGKSGISALKIMENVFILEEQESDLLEQQVGNLTISGSVSEDAATYKGGASAKSNSSDEPSQNTPKIVETSRPVKPNSLDDLQRSASEFNSSRPVKPNSLDELQRSASEFNSSRSVKPNSLDELQRSTSEFKSQNSSNTGEKQRVTSGDVEKRTAGEQAKDKASTTLKQGMAGAENEQSSASSQGTSMTASRGGQIYTGSGSSKKKKSKSAKGKSKNVPQPPSPATSVDKDPGAASAQPSLQSSLDEKGASSGEPRSLKESTSIKAENRKLKKEAICKICLDKPVAIVFLPCGHLVTCEECSQAMRKCPICRGPVNGSVRAFRS